MYATTVAGTLTTNATWSSAGNPYLVTSNFTVQPGVTLTLNPNVVVQIGSGLVFDVQGTLTATGFATAPVSFTNPPGQTLGGSLSLSGVGGALSATGTFRYCRFVNLFGTEAALSVSNAYVDISYSKAEALTNRFLFARNSRLNVIRNTTYDTGEALGLQGCAGLIASNHFSRINNGDAINLDVLWTGAGDATLYILGNHMANGVDDGIDMVAGQVLIDGNIITNIVDKALALDQGSEATIRNNILFQCGMGVAVRNSADPVMVNNTIVSCTNGIRSYPNGSTNGGFGSASNMIIWNCGTPISLEGNSTLSVGASTIAGTNVWPGTGNTTNNPLFVDLAANRFRLLAASPARNAGVTEPWMSTNRDVGGQLRVQDGTVDRGAHEFTPSGEVEVLSPNGRDVFSAGALIPISWIAYGTNWPASANTMAYASPDDGVTWTIVSSGLTSTAYVVTQNLWSSTNPPGSEYCRVRVVATNGANDQSDLVFTLVPPSVDHFEFASISSPQAANAPFNIRVTAYGTNGAVASGYLGTNSLRGMTGAGSSDVAIGTGSVPWDYPLHTYLMTARMQAIYLVGEIGGAKVIDGIQFNVTDVPPQPFDGLTLRIQETAMSAYPTSSLPVWSNSNWTTVYQANTTISASGLVTLNFSTPFVYSGLSNLLVDLSFSNDYSTLSVDILSTTNGQRRTLYYAADDYEGYGVPHAWVGPNNPTPDVYLGYPNIHLLSSGQAGVGHTPTQLVPFVNGVWTGPATVLAPITNIYFKTDDGQGRTGQSVAFSVVGGAQPVVVTSLIPGVIPPPGTNYFMGGSVVTCYVPSAMVEIPLATQFVANGWVGGGNVPPTGTGTLTTFTLTTNSSITWNWITSRVYVAVATQGNGTVDIPGAWLGPSSNFTRTVTPGPNNTLLSWSGTTNGCTLTTNQISGPVLYKRSIVATFQALVATNGVPVSWLQQYYPSTNNYDNAALSDTDADGMLAWEEWRSGTDPTLTTSVFAVVRITLSNGLPTIVWSAVTNKTYYIRQSTNLKSGVWSTITSGVPAANASFQISTNARAIQYKIGVE